MTNSCYVGIDLGGSSAKGAAISGKSMSEVKRVSTGAHKTPEALIRDIADLALRLAEGKNITALGLGVPGLVDVERGVSVFSGNLNWHNVPIVSRLSERLQAPVFIDNDVRVGSLGELYHGAARGHRDFIYLAIGTGIGSGIYVDGKLLRGPRWAAGEVGHMVLLPDGPTCSCGSRGCLEALASASAIAREAKLAVGHHPNSLILRLCDGDTSKIDAAVVAKADSLGDPTAAALLDKALDWLGVGVANLVNLFNPELVVLGGGASLMGERMLSVVRRHVERSGMPVQRNHVKIILSALGDLAGVYGALALSDTRDASDTGDGSFCRAATKRTVPSVGKEDEQC